MQNKYTILGRPLQIGDAEQIAWLKQHQEILKGRKPAGKIKFVPLSRPASFSKKLTGQPAYIANIICPACSTPLQHIHKTTANIKTENINGLTIQCYKCNTQLQVSNDGKRNLYVKQ